MKSKNRCHNYEDDVNIIDSNKLKNSLHKQIKTEFDLHPGRKFFTILNNQEKDIEKNQNIYVTEYNTAFKNFINNFCDKDLLEENLLLSQKTLFEKIKTKKKNTYLNLENAISKYDEYCSNFLIRNNVKKRNWTELELKIMVFLIAIYQIINQKEVNKFNDSDWKNIATHLIDKQYDGVKFKWNSIQKSIPILQEWDSEEDRFITNYINNLAEEDKKRPKWSSIAVNLSKFNKNVVRLGKHVRERYFNHLDPKLNRGEWTPQEDIQLLTEVKNIGKKWSTISKKLIGRTENAVRNRFISLLSVFKKYQNKYFSPDSERRCIEKALIKAIKDNKSYNEPSSADSKRKSKSINNNLMKEEDTLETHLSNLKIDLENIEKSELDIPYKNEVFLPTKSILTSKNEINPYVINYLTMRIPNKNDNMELEKSFQEIAEKFKNLNEKDQNLSGFSILASSDPSKELENFSRLLEKSRIQNLKNFFPNTSFAFTEDRRKSDSVLKTSFDKRFSIEEDNIMIKSDNGIIFRRDSSGRLTNRASNFSIKCDIKFSPIMENRISDDFIESASCSDSDHDFLLE